MQIIATHNGDSSQETAHNTNKLQLIVFYCGI